jgi:CheY-like chemotaxis protein
MNTPDSTSSRHARPHRAPPAILLVEDDEFHRRIAMSQLRRLGYTNVRTADDGRGAVQACSEADFDLVLMDCHMPHMNGPEAARAIRALGVREPIIAFTASTSRADRSRCIEAGMNDHLDKPATSAMLARKLQQWLAA